MSCYHPMPAVRLDSGDVSLSWGDREKGSRLQLPCGSCLGCRRDRVMGWSLRCQHEAQMWDSNQFLTLTYDDKHLPPLSILAPRDMQLFLKKLRKHYRGVRVRFFGVGEYGEQSGRPHYHLLLFNLDISDRKRYNDEYWTSPTVDKLWGKGQALIGDVTPKSCSYVAGYALKKVRQSERREPKELIDPDTGECAYYVPPFARMSNRPGIGATWYAKYGTDLHRGFVPVSGRRMPIPRYYSEKMKVDVPARMEELEQERLERDRIASENDPTYWYGKSQRRRDAAEHIARTRGAALKKRKLV